jgi:hypothetical protein
VDVPTYRAACTNRNPAARARPLSSERTSAVEGAAPSLIAGWFSVDRMDVAELIFGPRKHVGNKSPHDLSGLLGSPSMDRDLDRDYMAVRCRAHVRQWRCQLMLSQRTLLVELARCPGWQKLSSTSLNGL